ncbi:hypothetical protein O6H91_04G034800 [Diphasiastrum complanatum]|uniref:Uncharacterized protein n=1 Tax=Diphasiastrum complanatum TaxID=34168 RepID=A0ACC2DVV6_DIPCM|nr:hypothetical protein O6H91_04G034800 [Diphasiastrum complanatum]
MPKPQKFDELHHTPNNIKRSYAGASQLSLKLPKPRHANYIEKSSGLEFERSMMKRASKYSERSSNKEKNVGFLQELSPSDSDNGMVQRALDSSEISMSSFSENADVVSPSGDSKLLANKDTLRKKVAESSNASLKPVVKHSIFNRPVAFKSLNCSEVVKRKENAADPKKISNQKLSPTSSASMLRRAEFHESPRVCKSKERSMQHSAYLASRREAKDRMKNISRSLVLDTLKKFDLLRRKILRDENFSCRRPDLGAGKMMIRNRLRINELKRIGSVPGIEVGDQFFFRIEMLIVGLHMQVQAGIDFIVAKESRYNEPVAVSIIASVGYDYDRNNGETLIYTGQGGNVHRDQKQQEDQQLVRGNLALRNSNKNNLPVRVIRCYDRKNDKSDKIYTYDGLYQVVRIWHEISEESGCLVYKFCLQRLPDQPQSVKAFAQSLYSSFKD